MGIIHVQTMSFYLFSVNFIYCICMDILYQLRSSTFCSFLPPLVTSSLLGSSAPSICVLPLGWQTKRSFSLEFLTFLSLF